MIVASFIATAVGSFGLGFYTCKRIIHKKLENITNQVLAEIFTEDNDGA